ncbi:branched-chain amino acid ABC transporter permease [Nocardioides daphniae]|uniref:Branched-chain amino acid ABC transporter permease n=1 Tax=Nocardioides daphniae TaxID=402297 RepID=A0A4P7U8X5_9ACTN|nr:branched-chain amino acid ABC transporter permease [Nocardioides daphniae]QCC76456.1 branched-chain amino acid ABC transporter permease [Nocardioides daphniae]GGD06598.1 branched-chain amino acid ABC transporter permease [Nocardioides daphniae]
MQDLLNAATLGSIYLLFALGMALVWGTIGILNFAHGATFMFSAFVGHLVSRETELPFLGVIGVAVVTGAVISTLTQLLAFQPILKRSKSQHHAEMRILIGGIGVAAIPLALAQRETRSSPFGFTSSYKAEVFEILGLRLTTTSAVIIVAGLAMGIGLTLWLRRSRQGLALRAIGVDAETSSGMGVNRTALALGTMAVAGALAGLAGALLTFHLGAIAPETGDQLIIKAFAVIVLGGLGSMLGTVIGAYVLASAETFVLYMNWGTWVDAVSFGLIFLILLARPQGLLGRKEVRRT